MTVQAILNKKGTQVLTIGPGSSVLDAVNLLTEKNIGAVVVCDPDARIVGILSERDIVRGISHHGQEALEFTIDRLMTSKVTTCTPEDNVKHIMMVMTAGHFRHFPAVEDGELKGILSIGDVVKYRLDEAQLEIDVMRDHARSR